MLRRKAMDTQSVLSGAVFEWEKERRQTRKKKTNFTYIYKYNMVRGAMEKGMVNGI